MKQEIIAKITEQLTKANIQIEYLEVGEGLNFNAPIGDGINETQIGQQVAANEVYEKGWEIELVYSYNGTNYSITFGLTKKGVKDPNLAAKIQEIIENI